MMLLSHLPAHPGWILFALYFLLTHVATYYVVWNTPYSGAVALAWILLQSVRWMEGCGNKSSDPMVLSQAVVALNRLVLLSWFRINFLWTLSLSILFWSSPFLYVTWAYGWFYGGALSLFLVVMGVLLRGQLDRRLVQRRLPLKGSATKKKRVAVIGAGTAGLMTLKEMKAKGHDVVVLEASGDWGGVWSEQKKGAGCACGSRVTGSTMSSSSIANSMFGDYQTLREGSNPLYPTHFMESDYRAYLENYVQHFGLPSHVRLHTKVSKVEKLEDDSYNVTWTTEGLSTTTEHFDVVAVCTGLNQEIRPANHAQLKKANIQHTSGFDTSEYADKHVVIVGLGESSTDTAADIARVARHVTIICRSPTLLLPRNTFGTNIAPDHKLTRALLHCPQYVRTMKLMSQTILFGPFDFVARCLGVTSFGVTPEDGPFQDNWSWDWWILFHRLSTFHPDHKGAFALTRGQVTKTAPLVEAFRQGKVSFVAADITSTEEADDTLIVQLSDGTSLQGVDDIINATGYTTTFPFLSEKALQTHKIQERYRLVYHPSLPNMPFIGLARGSVGSIFFATELQARWAALVASHERVLPDAATQEKLAKQHAAQQAGKWPTKISMVYANAISRYEIGCEPDLSGIFLTSPKAWFYLMFGPFCVSMFRFRGPDADPEQAKGVFERSPRLVFPLEFPLQQGMELLLGVLVRFWSSLWHVNSLHQRSAILRHVATPFVDLNN